MRRMRRPVRPYHGSGRACPCHGSPPYSPLSRNRQPSPQAASCAELRDSCETLVRTRGELSLAGAVVHEIPELLIALQELASRADLRADLNEPATPFVDIELQDR